MLSICSLLSLTFNTCLLLLALYRIQFISVINITTTVSDVYMLTVRVKVMARLFHVHVSVSICWNCTITNTLYSDLILHALFNSSDSHLLNVHQFSMLVLLLQSIMVLYKRIIQLISTAFPSGSSLGKYHHFYKCIRCLSVFPYEIQVLKKSYL